jgi:formylglycine-generating enzyme required for sulfatase activity
MKRNTVTTAGVFCAISCLTLLSASAAQITIETVPIGNPGNAGNAADTGDEGAVSYNYRIGTYEVTNAQYAEFLNAKAASDPLGLYNTSMSGVFGGITRTGLDGSYSYTASAGRESKPVNYVSWYDAIRFANWLHNGQAGGDTETGAYTLGALNLDGTPVDGDAITRNGGAIWFLTSEDEWYKAAYHKNDGVTGNYFAYPTSSDTAPTAELPPGGSNSANYFPAVGDLSDAGAYTESGSPYDTFDQGGNVAEWNETLETFIGSTRQLRGGAWDDGAFRLEALWRDLGPPTYEDRAAGFRVATVPESSTLALAGGAAAGLLIAAASRRRRSACVAQI